MRGFRGIFSNHLCFSRLCLSIYRPRKPVPQVQAFENFRSYPDGYRFVVGAVLKPRCVKHWKKLPQLLFPATMNLKSSIPQDLRFVFHVLMGATPKKGFASEIKSLYGSLQSMEHLPGHTGH